MSARKALHQDFFKKWTSNMAYVLGYFAADGSMIAQKRGGKFIEFTSTDRTLLVQVRSVIGSTHRLSKRLRYNLNLKQAYRLQIGSKEWFNDLSSLGFTLNKSHTLKFPRVPSQFLGDFVRGYFDGDGCVYFQKLQYADRKRPRYILLTLFTSGSRGFLESLHTVLKQHDIHGGVIKQKTRGFELMFSHRDSLALYRFMYHTAKTSNLFLARKRQKLERAIRVLKLTLRV